MEGQLKGKNVDESFKLNVLARLSSSLLEPELAHKLFLESLKVCPIRFEPPKGLEVETSFGRIKSPIGLAAGYDKTGKYASALAKLGFGYVVIGTFTLEPKKGNPKPRVAYRAKESAAVNAMGLPNPGIREALKLLKRPNVDCKLLLSITGETVEEVVECYELSQSVADGIEVNVSSPTHRLNPSLGGVEFVKELAVNLSPLRKKPTYLKISPPENTRGLEGVLKAAEIWIDKGFEGITAVNTLMVDAPELSLGKGGLSGRPLKEYMLKTVSALRSELGSDVEINAVGGIFTGADATEALKAGANTVQLYTALLYRGPGAPVKVAEELLQFKEAHKQLSVAHSL